MGRLSLTLTVALIAVGSSPAEPPAADPAHPVPTAHETPAKHSSLRDHLHCWLHGSEAEKPAAHGCTTRPYPFVTTPPVPVSRTTTYERFGFGWGINGAGGLPGLPAVNLVGGSWW